MGGSTVRTTTSRVQEEEEEEEREEDEDRMLPVLPPSIQAVPSSPAAALTTPPPPPRRQQVQPQYTRPTTEAGPITSRLTPPPSHRYTPINKSIQRERYKSRVNLGTGAPTRELRLHPPIKTNLFEEEPADRGQDLTVRHHPEGLI